MFPESVESFSDLFAEIVTLIQTLELDFVLAAGAVIGLGGWVVRLVKRAAR